jgi:hypothetical protein
MFKTGVSVSDAMRRKSPRAPSISLDEAVDRAISIYDKERRHAAPTDIIAQNLGYKSANNGAALSVIASLRSFGLLEKAQVGKLSVAKELETYRFAPTEEMKSQLRIKWLKTPAVFSELLESYKSSLPSDVTLRFDFIQRGFTPASAESTLAVFRRSVDFAKYFEQQLHDPDDVDERAPEIYESELQQPLPASPQICAPDPTSDCDRIPVRLVGGRRAWLEIPTPFHEADKARLIAQINLILTEEDDLQP